MSKEQITTSTVPVETDLQKEMAQQIEDAATVEEREAARRTYELTMAEQLAHGKMVSNLAYHIGKELGLDGEELNDLIVAGFFHDIGKTELEMHTTDRERELLLVEEMNSIRQHPIKGYEILKRHGYNETICEAVLHHHENYDGSGYPGNMEGWNIPLPACILRVCDVFCALVSDRPYRGAFSPEAALEMMIEEVEKYDIKVFLAFQRVIHVGEGGEIAIPEAGEEVRGVWKTLWT